MDCCVVSSLVLFAFVATFIPAMLRDQRRMERRRRREQGLCQNCGYDLRASRGRCPECGEEIQRWG